MRSHKTFTHAAAIAALVLAGCSKYGNISRAPHVYTSVDSTAPLRLSPLVLTARQTNTANPVTATGFWFSAERFTQESERVFTRLTQRIGPVLAQDYNECRIRLKSPVAGRFTFVWQNGIEPDIAKNPGIPFTVIGGDDVHDYTIALAGQEAAAWAGTINAIGIAGPGEAIELESIILANASPEGPERITLGNVTMESVAPNPLVWSVAVRPGAQFEAGAGLLESAAARSDGVVFRVLVREMAKEPVALVEKMIGPSDCGKWQVLRASLDAFAGKKVDLLFDVDAGQNARGDVAVWGNPIIYGPQASKQTPIVLISCDTMRADHLSCYGYARETSPNMDAFAKEAVLFENAITPETWTLSAHTSMLTGLYPIHHRVNASACLAESVATLPETLAGAGYLTGGFTGYRLWLSPDSGIAHGFDTYSTPKVVRAMPETKEQVDTWLDGHAGAPFFLFFHNYDLHSKFGVSQCAECEVPYYPPPNTPLHFAKGVSKPDTLEARCRPSPTDILIAACGNDGVLYPEDIAYMVAMYDDSIRGVDAGLAECFEKLKALGVYDDALIVITADHGEHFGEHNQFVHEHVYEGAARVPLLIKFPHGNHAGKRIHDMVQLIDLMPTILDVAGVPAPAMDGHSLLPLIKGEGQAAPWAYIRRQTVVAVRNNEWKYLRNIESGAAEMFHLADDPSETVNVLDLHPAESARLAALADEFFSENRQGWHVALMRPKRDWRATVTATTGDSFQTVKLLLGGSVSYSNLIKSDEHSATVQFGLLPREDLLLRAKDRNAPVSLRIHAPKPFIVVLGDAEPVKGKKFAADLDPGLPPLKPDLPASVDKPTFFVWYEPESAEGARPPALTPEEIEALNALGYGREISHDTGNGRPASE